MCGTLKLHLLLNHWYFLCRSKDVDWMPYFTQRLVDDFASHIRLYRRASDKVQANRTDGERHKQGYTLASDIGHGLISSLKCLHHYCRRQKYSQFISVLGGQCLFNFSAPWTHTDMTVRLCAFQLGHMNSQKALKRTFYHKDLTWIKNNDKVFIHIIMITGTVSYTSTRTLPATPAPTPTPQKM